MSFGVFARTPLRGATRGGGRGGVARSPGELAEAGVMPDRFRRVAALYLQDLLGADQRCVRHGAHQARRDRPLLALRRLVPSDCPGARARSPPTEGKGLSSRSCSRKPRASGRADDSTSAYAWLVDVRTFFADLIDWAAEPGSPFAGCAPTAPPLTRNDLRAAAVVKSRRRRAAKTQATVLDLERGDAEDPGVRAADVERGRRGCRSEPAER